MGTEHVVLLGLVILVIVVIISGRSRQQNERLARLESKLDAISEHLGVHSRNEVDPMVLGLVQAGRTIEAMEVYRKQTGASLKEAKDHVDRLVSSRT